MRYILSFVYLGIWFGLPLVTSGQSNPYLSGKKQVRFIQHEQDPYGLSTPEQHPNLLFDTVVDPRANRVEASIKTIKFNTSGIVNVSAKQFTSKQIREFRFVQSGTGANLKRHIINDTLLSLNLPRSRSDYTVFVYSVNRLIAALNVWVLQEQTEKVIVVPMLDNGLVQDKLSSELNRIFGQACLKLQVELKPFFHIGNGKDFKQLSNPISTDQYTDQMRLIRDAYFKTFPKADKKAFYLFVTPPFVNPKQQVFCVKSKSLSFIAADTSSNFSRNCASVLAQSIGYLKETKQNLENLLSDRDGVLLDHQQWQQLRHNSHTFSIYDNYEDIQSNNGSVAYYFWIEDDHGNILLNRDGFLASVKRPYKKNYVSYHLDITEFMYFPRLEFWGRKYCFWHLTALLSIFPMLAFLRVRILKKFYRRFRKPSFWRIMSAWMILGGSIFFTFLSFEMIEAGYQRFEVKTGLLKDLGKLDTDQAIESILHNENIKQINENQLTSEILIRINDHWHVKKRARVLYFDVVINEKNELISARFSADGDSLILENPRFRMKARSHYMVLNFRGEDGKLRHQKLYNHLGIQLDDKLATKDAVNRVLVFVNGYRPTSMGHNFEDNFESLRNNGLEYPNSNNIIYDFDRYDYWRPWNTIDSMFISRINPNKTYYADGHFSVSTSNHRSLLDFTALAAVYPKRCKDQKHHTCYQTAVTSSGWFGSKNKKTSELLRMSPNYNGFKERYTNGRIAGRSLLQELNEIPNRSENDTIYFVAHSMGYAYALGMIKELRGKIEFGGFYILAPENASCGKVILKEWKEVWQYGSNFNPGKEDAPCLQDGVAPQIAVNGLTNRNRCYFPPNYFLKKGFFDSHFVGHYSWIFDLPESNKGYIRQR
jgi:hypothetical protein